MFKKTERKSGAARSLKQNPINKISKKGVTLGAQHASHGDSGTERLQEKKTKN
jgi:hypothetical protein